MDSYTSQCDERALHNIYWLAGSPCAGKTTIARALAARFNWRIYHCDDWFANHRDRSTIQAQPTFHHLSRLQGDALWLRPIADQISSEIHFCADEFTLVLEDLHQLAAHEKRPILFEGTPALPHVLKPLLPTLKHGFWLIPTESFQYEYYARRPWIHPVLATTSDPQRAFTHWMARDGGFARWLETQLQIHHLPWLQVDGAMDIDETVEHIARHFGEGDKT